MGKFCCCNCIFSCVWACIFQILCTIIVIFGIVVLAVWLIWRPNKVYFHVSDASLAKFDLSTSTNILNYDLNLNFDIRNSNRKIGVYFDFIEARTIYHHERFATMNLESFYQEPRNTTILHPVIKGLSVVHLGGGGDHDKTEYEEEKKSGFFNIYTMFYMHIRLKSGWITTGKIKLVAGCELKVPNKTFSSTFERTNCLVLPWDHS